MKAYAKIKDDKDKGIRPMYRPREWRRKEREKWYSKGGNESVIFVPATNRSELKSRV